MSLYTWFSFLLSDRFLGVEYMLGATMADIARLCSSLFSGAFSYLVGGDPQHLSHRLCTSQCF